MAIIKNPLTLMKSAGADIDPIYWEQINEVAYVPIVMPVSINNLNIVSSTTTEADGLTVILA